MKYVLLWIFANLLVTINAQVTMSFAGRIDKASVIGYSNPTRSVSEKHIRKGIRSSYGVEFLYFPSKNQALISGAEYLRNGFDYLIDDVGSGGWEYLAGKYSYSFISFPVGYRRYTKAAKWRCYYQVSASPMIYLRTTISPRWQQRDLDKVIEVSDGFQTFHLAASAALGVERTLFKSWTIGFQPTFRVHITSVTYTEFKEHPWTAGLQLNIGRVLSVREIH